MKKFKLIVAIILVVFISVFISKDRLLKKDKEPTVIAQHYSNKMLRQILKIKITQIVYQIYYW
ncbi:hypothetical protein RHG51_10260 [Clostridioides difficile]|nr:hypothetical protein [Clostridioides difficile]